MPEFDIIIPHYGITPRLTDLCVKCLESIHCYSANYRIVLIDNGSTRDSLLAVRSILRDDTDILFPFGENLGFVGAVNFALKFVMSDFPLSTYIVLMNNDTEAAPDWLEKLKFPLDRYPKAGAASPRTTARQCWQGNVRETAGVRKLSFDSHLASSSMLAFFCCMFKREVFEKVGLLEEKTGIGLGDDDIFCHRMHMAGYDLYLVNDLIIPHHHRSTFRTLYSEDEIVSTQWHNYAMYWQERIDDGLPRQEILKYLTRIRHTPMAKPVADVLRAALA